MLHELVVRNLGVIEEASVVLAPGMTALTGETGAGKTLVTEAINLLTGGRADAVLVRPGADEATVEGRFVLDDDAEIVVRRVVPSDGRSRAYLDGNFATIAELNKMIAPLVEVHGQHGHQKMLRSSARRDALDRFGGHDLGPLAETRSALRDVRAQLDELGGDELARNREIELLRYQVDEIEQVGIADADEDTRLTAQEALLGDAASHRDAAARSIELLSTDGEIGAGLAQAISELDERVPFQAATSRLYAIQAEIADLVEELRTSSSGIDDDPETLVRLQERRQVLTGLRRKYGDDLAEVMSFGERAAKRLDELEHHGERATLLEARIDELDAQERAESAKLLQARRASALKLAGSVQKELRKLALPKAEFQVVVEGAAGNDVDFAVSMNPGAPVLPIAKVASGGELSRVMLALQLVVGGDTSTVIYDEVDAGVGGEAATSIGQALAGVGKGHQVLVVTHLPQVAACANHQVNIAKTASRTKTITELHDLDREGRIIELARMLSGSPDSESARVHAAELLDA